ncbi:MAG: ATP-binding cassette domain-containing protein [Chitinophagaceae bacterium]|nr:MAG: ATP-binding cassette domain-containing protein [Chitinophagaceae bacterium]
MEKNIIIVDDLWKQYKLGDINSSSLKEEVHHWWNRYIMRNKHDGQINIAEENNLTENGAGKAFWALREINFEVKQGEALGIIGKNGAGKSTLLKILSRITRPTRGTVRGYGRVASMLEVGTGFHSELTGRENIFLNGNILGMSNREINQKFDAIVDFSGISKFIDTPVKRYSSGMYVRLAFAVAAHLDPDILLLDEVLAVGDAEFQEKCLMKMKEIINDRGCTILFVSHNISSVLQLCSRAILLKEGRMADEGDPRYVVNSYYELIGKRNFYQIWDKPEEAPGNEVIKVKSISLRPEWLPGMDKIDIRTPIQFQFDFFNYMPSIELSIGVHLFTASDECIFDISSVSEPVPCGEFESSFVLPGDFLNYGDYYLSVMFLKDGVTPIFYLEKCLVFEVVDYREDTKWKGDWMGAVRPKFPIRIIHKKNKTIA